MNHTKALLIALLLAAACILILAGCGSNNAPLPSGEHTHKLIKKEATVTCTENGEITHYICSDCKQTFADAEGQTPITDVSSPAFGHSFTVEMPAKEATCGSIGWHAHTECANCGEKSDYTEIPRLGGCIYDKGVCTVCHTPHPGSAGIVYELKKDGKGYYVKSGGNAFGAIIIACTYEGLPVTEIGEGAFYHNTALSSVTIPSSITHIGGSSFENCSRLTEIIFAEDSQLTSVGDKAFRNAVRLASTELPSKLASIGASAFSGCRRLTSISLPASLTKIEDYAFEGCTELTGITLPNSVTKIGAWAFYGCSKLLHIVLPDSVTSMGNAMFYGCTELTSVVLPKDMTSIGDHLFHGCLSLNKVTVPSSLTSIGNGAFFSCSSLTSMVLPQSLTSIAYSAFERCYRLAEIYNLSSLPIEKGSQDYGCIGYYALDVYTSLSEESKLYQVDDYVFHKNGDTAVLIGYLGKDSAHALPNDMTAPYSINRYAFAGEDDLTSITLSTSVTGIGWYAFQNCTGLTSISFHGTVAEWKAVPKGSFWNDGTPNYTVICTDGTLNKNGNVIGG